MILHYREHGLRMVSPVHMAAGSRQKYIASPAYILAPDQSMVIGKLIQHFEGSDGKGIVVMEVERGKAGA